MVDEQQKLTLQEGGELVAHGGWVTCLATGNQDKPGILVSGSRDKTIVIWDIDVNSENFGRPLKALRGHAHYIQDLVISSDNQFALTASWDNTMRLWSLDTGKTMNIFQGHSKDVMSVTISPDNRQIISGGRDKTIRLWNTLAQEKYKFSEQSTHTDWVSQVRFTPQSKSPLIISAGWDGVIKLWKQENLQHKQDLEGHQGPVNAITISPDGIFCASGGKDQRVLIWDLKEGKQLYSLEANSVINSLTFSPMRYWLAAATDNGVIVWDLQFKQVVSKLSPEVFDRVKPDKRIESPKALSVSWSADGNILFAGFTDSIIRVYNVVAEGAAQVNFEAQ